MARKEEEEEEEGKEEPYFNILEGAGKKEGILILRSGH